MVAGIWVYAFAMVAPTLSNTYGMSGYGTFGYNEALGKCDYDDDGFDDVFYSIGFCLPLILIVLSYFGIRRITLRSSSNLKHLG